MDNTQTALFNPAKRQLKYLPSVKYLLSIYSIWECGK